MTRLIFESLPELATPSGGKEISSRRPRRQPGAAAPGAIRYYKEKG
jgi:hypothetical protein